MIISVNWLMKNAIFNDQNENETVIGMWERKASEMSDGFVESISEHGVMGEIVYSLEENRVYNGHHRLLVAWLLGIEYIGFVDDLNDNPEDYLERLGWPSSYKENDGKEEGP
ncbi:ParB N-terminal domain-containing protein [Streptomyces phage Coruscant]|jgi:hypothetical protein|uniref:ParB N-terminal domain-containing protein n=1 Tax=Streptomyces phage Coruscant TaxID=2739834 RepID=A0A7G4AWH4_9CAUD|nr:ParB N-terminal domain-containing protein [Streptomyces phage Coruscant]YP_010651599.1 ParB N-terminal domain-containing protein [Streptomyces phage Coruscant]QMP84140.1 ParB N-terminal domain-containing protein [Streptomyces phage Coruscant]QMP84364.1 ParB N-terminal domain-containing protein [Streptomyces phage Coruscant]